jgi:IclR family acetate operon transcriptional repressor
LTGIEEGARFNVMKDAVPANETPAPYSIRAVDRALDILDVLRARPRGASLAQVARATELPRSSAFRYLAALEARGYVTRDGGARPYRLGPAFAGGDSRLQVLAAAARPLLEELRDRFKETINLGVLDGNGVLYLDVLESPKAIRFAARAGERDPIHSTALGKALAGQLADDEVRRILVAEGMPALTPRTITDPDEYLRQLVTVRKTGYAHDNGENEEHGGCIAVAITGVELAAALSLSAPTARLASAGIEEIAEALRQTAARVGEEVARAHA